MYSILPAAKRYSFCPGHCSTSQPVKGPASGSQQPPLIQIPQSAVMETCPVIAKLRNQENQGTKRHSEKLGDENLCVKRALRLFLAGEERYQEKYKHQRTEPGPFTATSLPVPRKAQDIQIWLSFLHLPLPNKHTSLPLHHTLCPPHSPFQGLYQFNEVKIPKWSQTKKSRGSPPAELTASGQWKLGALSGPEEEFLPTLLLARPSL